MATPTQVFANRANAQLSTGPRTPQGISNCRHNATRHGLTGAQVVIKGEDPAEYDSLRAELIHHYAPSDEREAMLIEEITQNWWRLQRARRIEVQVLEKFGQFECMIDPEAKRAFQTITRYLNKIERSWNQACRDLEKLQQPLPARIGSVSQPRPAKRDRSSLTRTVKPEPDPATLHAAPAPGMPPAPPPAAAPARI